MLLSASSDFMTDPPRFTITGVTRGGPPTETNWTKDGATLIDAIQFSISVAAVPQNTETRYRDTIYESTLTVTGRQPGYYRYAATNPVSPLLSDIICIEGMISTQSTCIMHVELGTIFTVEPSNKGHFGTSHFCPLYNRKAVLFQRSRNAMGE